MKKSEPQQIEEIIHEVFRRSGQELNEARQRACMMWMEVVGPTINRMTTRRRVDADGALHVYITSASLKQDLQFEREKIRQALNQLVGTEALTSIIIH